MLFIFPYRLASSNEDIKDKSSERTRGIFIRALTDLVTSASNNYMACPLTQLKGSVKEPNMFRNYETEKIARKVYAQLLSYYSARLRYCVLKVTSACYFQHSAH